MIERLNLDDPVTAGQVWRLQHAAFAAEWREIGGGDFMPVGETVAELQSSNETFFGIAVDGELAAAVSCLSAEKIVMIRRLMVRPDMFRRGLATRLLRHVEEQYGHCRRIEAYAAANNLPAVRLYESAGYRDCGEMAGSFNILMKRFCKDLS